MRTPRSALASLLALPFVVVGCSNGNDTATPGPDAGTDALAADAGTTGADAGVAAETGDETATDAAIEAGPADPRWPACDPSKTTQTLSFVHVNDLHANYQLDSAGVSPYARIRGYYKTVLADNPYTLFTSAGDDFEKGAIAEVLSQGASTLQILPAMQFDVRTIGNHDYGWSEESVLKMSHDPRTNILEANMTYMGSDPIGFGAVPYVALQIGCLKVGFAGLVSEPWNEQDQQIEAPFYPDFTADYDFNTQAKAIVAAHRSEVDVLVFIDHIGLSLDGLMSLEAPGIDVVLSGHSHELTTTPKIVGTTTIVQTGAFAEHVVRLDVTFDRTQSMITGTNYVVKNVDTTLPPDADMQTMVAGAIATFAPHGDDAVAQVQTAGTTESIATVAAKAAIAKFGADAAVVDTQTVWDLWQPGAVSDQLLLDAFKIERELPGTPGFNSFYTSTVTGADLTLITAGAGTRFVTVMPATIVPTQSYLLAIQKRPAYNPGGFFPGLTITSKTFGSEAWEALDFYGKQRQAACLYLDADVKIPGCT